MSISIVNLDNEVKENMELPGIFKTTFRPDVIKKAVLFQQSHGFQPQGRDVLAGKRTTAESRGVGLGIARVPRIKGGMRAAFGVSIVGGHQAFPPRSNKKISKKINKKERRLAIKSGIAATSNRDIVENRGHVIDNINSFPIVVEDDIQRITRTKDVRSFFMKIGIWQDVERSDRRKIRSGRGKTRGRSKKVGKGPLLIINEDFGIVDSASNLPGVEVVNVRDLNVELLAPGAKPGRLVIWSKSAFKAVQTIWGDV
jgi:large subunit ribosomal protein L4e